MKTSTDLYSKAREIIPGGVNSPVRAFRSTGMDPVFVKKSSGKYLYTENGEKLTDYCMSWGVAILGHNYPSVIKAAREALKDGVSYGLCHRYEAELARLIVQAVPSVEKIRFVSSGTEAVMSAIRLARGFTGRNKILKFDGCYHGHSDFLLVKAGSGAAETAESSSKGVPLSAAENTLSIPYNDRETAEKIIRTHRKDLACVVIEPIAGNMGLVTPKGNYLEFLRKITAEYGILLIFDEVITGLRVSLGGAQEFYGVRPDITVIGKALGAGFTVTVIV